MNGRAAKVRRRDIRRASEDGVRSMQEQQEAAIQLCPEAEVKHDPDTRTDSGSVRADAQEETQQEV